MATDVDVRRNRSGIEVKRCYGPEDVAGRTLEPPGVEPFTRGIHPTMYRGQLWSKRQLVGLDSPEAFNERQRQLIAAGTTAISLIVCNSTYRGHDVDEVPIQLVGTCGTPINCLEDAAISFAELPIGELSVALNDPSPFTVAAMLLVHAERTGVDWADIRGTSNQSDIISHFVANHMFLRLPPRAGLRVLVDHANFMRDHVPGWNPVSVVGQHMQQAGATPAQSVAFTLCSAIEYVGAICASGRNVDEFAARVTYFHDISMSLFEEAAKLRAQRRMWAKILRERFGAQEERTLKFKVHTQTSGADLTRQQPLNNIVRVTVQALAALLGGTQSLHTDAFDEALATPTEHAAHIALQTQNILAEETGIADVVDPLGGSYYVEALTDEIERAAWEIIEQVDRRGGMLQAVEDGWVQDEIGRSAWEFQDQVERGERTIVGVTDYTEGVEDAPESVPVQRVAPERVAAQIERVQRSREQRDQEAAAAARDRIRGLAGDPGDNAFGAIVDGVRAGLTHGEIVAATRDAFGFGRPLTAV